MNNMVTNEYFSVTTRNRDLCPDKINTAYDRNLIEDTSVTIRCNMSIGIEPIEEYDEYDDYIDGKPDEESQPIVAGSWPGK